VLYHWPQTQLFYGSLGFGEAVQRHRKAAMPLNLSSSLFFTFIANDFQHIADIPFRLCLSRYGTQ
jgi:hypothetical protein